MQGRIEARYAILVYDVFEEIVEKMLPCLDALFIRLDISKNKIKIKLQINCKEERKEKTVPPIEEFASVLQLVQSGGQILISEDQSLAIRLELPKGGDRA